MKSKNAVQKKLKDVKYRYLAMEYKQGLKVCHTNCIYNYKHKETGSDVEVGICTYGMENPEEWNGIICDTEDIAKACPLFTCKNTKDTLKKEFDLRVQDNSIVAKDYKDLAALQWVMDVKISEWDITPLQRFRIWCMLWFIRVSQYFNKGGKS